MFQALKGILKNVGKVLSSDTNNDSQIKLDFKTKHNDCDKLGLGQGLSLSNYSASSSLPEQSLWTKNAEMVQNSNNIEEPVILTLSSDEDDDDDGKSNASFQKSYLANSGEEAAAMNSGLDQPLNLHNKEPIVTEDFNNDIYERRHAKHPGTYLEKENHTGNSNYKTHTLNIQCRSIRIGSYQVTPTDKIAINAAGIQMKVQPFARGEKESVLVSIKIKKILKILASFESSRHTEQVIFLYLTPCVAEDIRSKLKMFDKKFFYFDPCSSEQSHRRITLFPDKMKADSVFLMKNILNFEMLDMTRHCKVYDLLEDLSYKEANDILTKSSTCEGDVSQSLPQETVKLFIYPPPPSKGGITITTADYQCLAEDTFLNDVLIDFHLKWMLLKKLSAQDNKKTHIMSSFFYKRLTAKPKKGQRPYHPVEDASNVTAARKRHDRVKSWTKSVDIFDKDFILIPINERSHWFLVVICFPGLSGPTKIADGQPLPANVATEPTRRSSRSRKSCEMIPVDDDDEFSDRDEAEGDNEELDNYFDDTEEPASKKQKLSVEQHPVRQPCILVFDSLSTRSRSKIVATLREYLTVEYFTKKIEVKEFNKMTMPGACPKVPQQRNFSDCGIFVMQYAESFFENPITDFTLPICSLANWFGQDVMHKKRESIASLLKELLSLYNPSRLCNLPPITFPSHKEDFTDKTETQQVDKKNQAEEDADSTTFSAVDNFPSSTQGIPMRRKININISRRSSNIERMDESDNRSLLNNLVSVSNSILASSMACNGVISCSNNTANKCPPIASISPATSLSSQQSLLQITSDNPSINSVKVFPKFGKPDYITHFEKLETNKTTGLQQIISNYDGSDGDSDDEIFVSSKKIKSISSIENIFTEPSVEATNAVQSLCSNSGSTVEIVEIEELTNVEGDNESEDVYANLSINNFEDSPRTDNLYDHKSP